MRRSRREQFAGILEWSGALSALIRWRERAPVPWLSILTFHRFAESPGPQPFDDGVIDVTPAGFERQVLDLKKHFSLIGTDELCEFAKGASLPKNPVAITFDDGYACVYKHALPILRRHGCKAIVFVATSFITNRSTHWWDRVAYILKKSDRRHLLLEYPFPIHLDLAEKSTGIERVLRLIKAHPGLDLHRLLDELATLAGVSFTREMDRAFADELLMSWDQIRDLRAAGIDVESHTRTHRVLATLSPGALELELGGSRDDLRRELGEAPRALAYPVGNPIARDSRIRTALVRAGYVVGLTNGTGPTPIGKLVDPFGIGRHTIGVGSSGAYWMTILAMPALVPRHRSPLDN